MAVSRRALIRLGLIMLALLLAVVSTAALVGRPANQMRSDAIEADLAGLDLIEARFVAMEAGTMLRLRLIEQGWEGATGAELDITPATEAAGTLAEQAALLAKGDGPLATEASFLDSGLQKRIEEGPDDDSYVGVMSFVDDLLSDVCCAGQNGGIRGVSDRVRTIDFLAYGHGWVSYFFDDVAGGLLYEERANIDEGGFLDYMGYNIEVARSGEGYSWIDDPLLGYFPQELEKEDPQLAGGLRDALDTEEAAALRDAVVWATRGDARDGVPAPVSPEQVKSWIEAVDRAQGDYIMQVITEERTALRIDLEALTSRDTVQLVLGASGFSIALALLFIQVRAIRRIQVQAELRRSEAQAKLDMLSVVAHELRTPLTGITGFTQFLHSEWRSLDDAQISEFLGLINGQAEELMRLIDDLLTIRRLETGNLDLHTSPVRVREVAERVARSVFRDGSRTVQVEADPDLTVSCDPDRMAQILRNLLDNARKYGGPTVKVTAVPADGRCRVVVSDDGDGVAAGDVERIFSRFDQGSAPGRAGTGFGLGLSIVKDLAQAMGGDVGYDSGVPSGAQFWVELPAVPEEAHAVPSEVAG